MKAKDVKANLVVYLRNDFDPKAADIVTITDDRVGWTRRRHDEPRFHANMGARTKNVRIKTHYGFDDVADLSSLWTVEQWRAKKDERV